MEVNKRVKIERVKSVSKKTNQDGVFPHPRSFLFTTLAASQETAKMRRIGREGAPPGDQLGSNAKNHTQQVDDGF